MHFDPQITATAAAVVDALVPFLKIGATEFARKAGSNAAERLAGLVGKVKERLTSSAKEAMVDLEKSPSDSEVQAVLRYQLGKQLTMDSGLHTYLVELVQELRSNMTVEVRQTATVVGDENVSIQISGSGNQVNGLGRP